MGVAGAGKTAVGSALAKALGWRFIDADDLHPDTNVAKMSGGTPLSDADREPWVRELEDRFASLSASGTDAVVACSALRAELRTRLEAAAADVTFVYLRVSPEVAQRRVEGREGHFMPASLVTSQFETLEAPEGALEVDAEEPIDAIVAEILRRTGR